MFSLTPVVHVLMTKLRTTVLDHASTHSHETCNSKIYICPAHNSKTPAPNGRRKVPILTSFIRLCWGGVYQAGRRRGPLNADEHRGDRHWKLARSLGTYNGDYRPSRPRDHRLQQSLCCKRRRGYVRAGHVYPKRGRVTTPDRIAAVAGSYGRLMLRGRV